MGQARTQTNFDFQQIKALAQALKKLVESDYQIGVVIGGGNIFRGRMIKNMEIAAVTADFMGMLATMMNALALKGVLEKLGQRAVVMSPFGCTSVWEPYSAAHAKKLLDYKNILIFSGGTGKPHFTTDTALVLRAMQIGAQQIFKATNVAGVYSSDPQKNKKAKFYKNLTYQQAMKKHLKVMDASAFKMAAKNNLSLTVFKYSPSNLAKAVRGLNLGTQVSNARRQS